MRNEAMQERLSDEVMNFIGGRRSLMLSTLTAEGEPYASYAPFAIGDNCLYVLLSEIAIHATNLQHTPKASVLIIEDEDSAGELFARIRVNYRICAELIPVDDTAWRVGIDILSSRLGGRIDNLSELSDFKLFRLSPTGGRYVKGFGRAYSLEGGTLAGGQIGHLREGHRKREAV